MCLEEQQLCPAFILFVGPFESSPDFCLCWQCLAALTPHGSASGGTCSLGQVDLMEDVQGLSVGGAPGKPSAGLAGPGD